MALVLCNQRFASPATRWAPLTDREPFADDRACLRFIHRHDCGIGRCRWSGWPAINAAERDSIGASSARLMHGVDALFSSGVYS